ncbi:MAG: hypothetical protein GY795_40980 [Desulfobacterales bacterium]|nr:hypothetical protein [Desulfobacterales bacterium]
MFTLYQENAFRILGIPSNSTRTCVRNAQQALRTRAKVGGLKSVDDPMPFLADIERTESSVRDAFNKLENPQTRLRERLFWFAENTPADGKAIAKREDEKGRPGRQRIYDDYSVKLPGWQPLWMLVNQGFRRKS